MSDSPPDAIIRETALSNQIMNVKMPEGVKHADKAGDKVFGFVYIIKHTKDNTATA